MKFAIKKKTTQKPHLPQNKIAARVQMSQILPKVETGSKQSHTDIIHVSLISGLKGMCKYSCRSLENMRSWCAFWIQTLLIPRHLNI